METYINVKITQIFFPLHFALLKHRMLKYKMNGNQNAVLDEKQEYLVKSHGSQSMNFYATVF